MKRILVLILFLAGAFGFALFALEDPGYVVIGRGVWAVETSLSLLIIGLFATGVVVYSSVRFLRYVWRLPTHLLAKRAQQKRQQAQRALEDGLIYLVQGNWQEAEQTFAKHFATCEVPLAYYLGAAVAAHQQAQPERMSAYLEKAKEDIPDFKPELVLLQANLYWQQQNLPFALKYAVQAKNLAPHEKEALWLLFMLNLQLANWKTVLELLPEIRKQKLLPSSQIKLLQERATQGQGSTAKAPLGAEKPI